MTSFDDGWTRSTWIQIFALSLVLSIGFQLLASRVSWNFPVGFRNTTDANAGTDDLPPSPTKDDSSSYQSPHGLRDPRINRHATVSFDTYITLDPEEINTIIEATPFTRPESSSRDDDVPDPNAEPQNAPDGDGRDLGREEGNERHTGTGRVEVPCYLPDGTRRDPVDLPLTMTRDLMERRIIALEVEGDILVLYRFQTGAQRVVHYDPDTESFTDLDLGDTFHGFPIARLDQPPN